MPTAIACTALSLTIAIVSCQSMKNPLQVAAAPRLSMTDDAKGCVGCGGTADDGSARGTGYFRSPLDILGNKICVTHMCEARVRMIADYVDDVTFTRLGQKTCSAVCAQYRRTMRLDKSVDVTMVNGYCDYTGVQEHPCDAVDLGNICACVYKLVFDHRRNKIITYTFELNQYGMMRVAETIEGCIKYVT